MENIDEFLRALKELIKETGLEELEDLKEPIKKIEAEALKQET